MPKSERLNPKRRKSQPRRRGNAEATAAPVDYLTGIEHPMVTWRKQWSVEQEQAYERELAQWDAHLQRLECESALTPIQKKLALDDDAWFELLKIFVDIRGEFTDYGAEWNKVEKRRQNVMKAARACVAAIEANNISNYWVGAIPWCEVFLPFIDTNEWKEILDTYERAEPNPRGRRVRKIATFQIMWKDPFKELPVLLGRFVDVLERFHEQPLHQQMLIATSRKNNLQEFAKRRVYAELKNRWPSRLRTAPNKETAQIVNCLLELHGSEQVTANDITQMNKASRRRYWKK